MLNSLRLNLYVKNHRLVGDNQVAAIKIFSDETKFVFEFCNYIVDTYKERYGITFDDFSTDEKFTMLLKHYMHQKEEVVDMINAV